MSDADFRVTRPDGVERWIHSQSVPLYGDDDTLVGYVHTVYDLTDRKLVESQLRGSLVEVRNHQVSDAGESLVVAEEVRASLKEAADVSAALREVSLPAELATQIDDLLKCIDSACSAAEALQKTEESVEDHSLDDILF